MNRGTFAAHPPEVIREARRLLLATKDPSQVSQALGIHRQTLLNWNRAYGWIKLQRGPKGPRAAVAGEMPRYWLDYEPERWRCCECGRLNTEATCGTCGYKPQWAA